VQESSLPATPDFDGLETDRYGVPRNGPTLCHDDVVASRAENWVQHTLC
jgi:hypothetical protein